MKIDFQHVLNDLKILDIADTQFVIRHSRHAIRDSSFPVTVSVKASLVNVGGFV